MDRLDPRSTTTVLAGCTRLCTAWRLDDDEVDRLLGPLTAGTWAAWRTAPPATLDDGVADRIALLVAIYAELHVLHTGVLADTWVRQVNTNRLFGGRTPLDHLLDGGERALREVLALLRGRR